MKSTTRWIHLALLIALLPLSACGENPGPSVPTVQARSALPRTLNPSVTGSNLQAVVSGNTAFAAGLFQELRGSDPNLFYSPYSISMALAMVRAGARGETAVQMDDALHFTLDQERLNPAWNALDQKITSLQKQDSQNPDAFKLAVVNAIWGQTGYTFLPVYLDLLAANYGAGMHLLDFQTNPDQARQTINEWVSRETEQKINDLLPQQSITNLTRLVLTNAVYFKAAWEHPFDEQATQEGAFTLPDGRLASVPMMAQEAVFPYLHGEGYQAVELPYVGGELSMLIVMPDPDQMDAFTANLDGPHLEALAQNLTPTSLALKMPPFKIESTFALADTLAKMGMPDAFNPDQADLSGMDGSDRLYISSVTHKAYITVDEQGTEAAAATGVVVSERSMPLDQVSLTIDHPFLFLIRDRQTGAILFLGQVSDPS